MPARKRISKASGVRELILKAVANSRERNGMPLSTLKKALAAGGYDVVKNKASVKIAIRNLLKKGFLVQTKGFGASAAFKINQGGVRVKLKLPRGKKAGRRGRKRAARRPAKKGRKRAGAKKSRKRGRRRRVAKRAAKRTKRSAKGRKRRGRKAGKKAAKRRARKAGSRRRRR